MSKPDDCISVVINVADMKMLIDCVNDSVQSEHARVCACFVLPLPAALVNGMSLMLAHQQIER